MSLNFLSLSPPFTGDVQGFESVDSYIKKNKQTDNIYCY